MKNNGKTYKVQLPQPPQDAAGNAAPAPPTLAPAPPRRALEQAMAQFEAADRTVLLAQALRDRA